MKKSKLIMNSGITFIIFFITAIFACTELNDVNYSDIISSEFVPTAEDIPALTGAPYADWRGLLLQWNTLYRAQEITSDEMLTPERNGGWVDGGVYRRLN